MSKDRDFSGHNRGRGGKKPDRENGYLSAGEVRAAKRESYKGGKSSGKHADSHKENHGKREEFRTDRETANRELTEEELSGRIEGRNAVIEGFRSGRQIDKLFVQEELHDGPISTVLREAKKHDTIVNFVTKERLDEMSFTGHHQGVIAQAAAFAYATVDDILAKAEERGEAPFVILLDGIEDPHNLGAIIRTACLAGAHGVILPKRRAVGLTPVAVRASAGAINYVPVARVTNIGNEIEKLKEKGLWFVCADMDGKRMYDLSLTGPIGLVVGSEGDGVSRLVKEKCDFVASIPMKGEIDSLNASVAAGVMMYEIVRQRGGIG